MPECSKLDRSESTRRARAEMAGRLAFLGLLLGLTACAGRRDPVEIADAAVDARIRRELQARFEEEPSLNGGQIRVTVEAARVTLHGSVQGIGAWNCAIRNASLVAEVEAVVDFLVIERGPRDVVCRARRAQLPDTIPPPARVLAASAESWLSAGLSP